MKEILLNRMYVGKFLEKNIGHEIINLIKDDNGRNYIYINPYGSLEKKHKNIETILLVRGINENTVEVIAKATGLVPVLDNSIDRNFARKNQKNYIKENKVKYSGVLLDKIYYQNEGTNEDYTVYISFKADCVFFPKKKIYLTTDKTNNISEKTVVLNKINFPKMALHWTYPENCDAYNKLKKLINDKNNWEKENNTKKISEIKKENGNIDFNFLNLIRKEYDELCFSNMFHYFLLNYKFLYKNF